MPALPVNFFVAEDRPHWHIADGDTPVRRRS
jgi:hypothetical protein